MHCIALQSYTLYLNNLQTNCESILTAGFIVADAGLGRAGQLGGEKTK